jgi:hypothetical protein
MRYGSKVLFEDVTTTLTQGGGEMTIGDLVEETATAVDAGALRKRVADGGQLKLVLPLVRLIAKAR